MARSNVITDIESKTKATRNLSLKSVLFLMAYLLVAYMFQGYVNGIFLIPYMIFSFGCGIFLLIPSSYNKKRNNLESLIILYRSEKITYRPFFGEDLQKEADDIG